MMAFKDMAKPDTVLAVDFENDGLSESEFRLQDGSVAKSVPPGSSSCTKSDEFLLPKKPHKRLSQNVDDLRNRQNLKSQLWKWFQILVVLTMLLIIVTSVYVLVSRPEKVEPPKSDQGTKNFKQPDVMVMATANNDPPPIGSMIPTLVNISSSVHLLGITKATETVVIYELKPSAGPPNVKIKDSSAVITLELRGPIDLKWLTYILASFQSLENLYVDVDKVCSGFSGAVAVESRGIVKLPKLEVLSVVNSKSCGILQWGNLTYEFPQLKEVQVRQAILSVDPPHFQALTELFNQTKSSLEGLEVSESYICDNCDLTEVEFPKLKWLKIRQRLTENPFEKNDDNGGEELFFVPRSEKKSAQQVLGDKAEDSNESYWAYDDEDYE